jgi:hypothetical protein
MSKDFRVFLVLVLAIFIAAPATHAAVPNLLAWQGVALDSTDAPLGDGMYTFHFAIYSDGIAGDSLWGESQTVAVENGVLNVLLGSVVPLSESVFDEPVRYLQVQFETQTPYVPRTRIVSVGYAFRVGGIDGAVGGTVLNELEVLGTQSALLDMNASGDGSVVLPSDAISSSEISDEPGMAAGVRSGIIPGIGASYVQLADVSANFPVPGYVMVISEGTFSAIATRIRLNSRLQDNGSDIASWTWDGGASDQGYDHHQHQVYTGAVSAGPHSFTLSVSQPSGSVTAHDAKVTVLFFPTAYGSVDAPAAGLFGPFGTSSSGDQSTPAGRER